MQAQHYMSIVVEKRIPSAKKDYSCSNCNRSPVCAMNNVRLLHKQKNKIDLTPSTGIFRCLVNVVRVALKAISGLTHSLTERNSIYILAQFHSERSDSLSE